MRLLDFLRRVNGSLDRPEYEELLDYMGRDALGTKAESLALQQGRLHETYANPFDWAGATFWCFTAVTTIGYGNYTPTHCMYTACTVYVRCMRTAFTACAQVRQLHAAHGGGPAGLHPLCGGRHPNLLPRVRAARPLDAQVPGGAPLWSAVCGGSRRAHAVSTRRVGAAAGPTKVGLPLSLTLTLTLTPTLP